MVNFSEHSPYVPPESGRDKSTDKDGKKKKNAESAPAEHKETKAEKTEAVVRAETLWQRVLGEEKKPAEDEQAEEQSTADAELEGEINLSDTEAKEIALEHVEDRQEAVASEFKQTEPGTVEATVAAADAVLLEHDQTHLSSDDETFREALTQAKRETEQAVLQSSNAEEQSNLLSDEQMPSLVPETPAHVTSQEPPQTSETAPRAATTYDWEQILAAPHAAEAVRPNTAGAPANEAQSAPVREVVYENPDSGAAGGLFAGGVFGYLWGRRRGRKQAERRFRPFQRKAERDIKQIKSEVAAQETHIRDLAARQYTLRAETSKPANVTRQPERAVSTPNRPIEAAPVTMPTERLASPKPLRTETLPSLNHAAETLNDRETLAWAEKIIIDGASVRSVYEAKRISESGLKYVVHEYLRGGNVRKALAEEMLQKELSYERDPILREHFAGAEISASGVNTFGSSASLATPNAAAPKLASKLPTQATLSNLATSPRSMAMAAWVTLIIVLACVAAILLLTK